MAFYGVLYAVHSTLNAWTYDFSNDMYDMGMKMLDKFNKYWGDPTKMNKFLFVSVVLDPRHKLQFVVYMLKDMYGEEVGGNMGKSLEETIYKMFNEYKSRMGSNNDVREDRSLENIDSGNPLLRLWLRFEKDSGMVSHSGSSDLDEYLCEKTKTFRDVDDFDILAWWKLNSMRFPVLSQMARDVLAMPISTVASESAFSTGGRVLNDFRSSLTPKMVQALVCAQDWMRTTAKAINVEEDYEEMVKLDEELKKIVICASGSGTPSASTNLSSTPVI